MIAYYFHGKKYFVLLVLRLTNHTPFLRIVVVLLRTSKKPINT